MSHEKSYAWISKKFCTNTSLPCNSIFPQISSPLVGSSSTNEELRGMLYASRVQSSTLARMFCDGNKLYISSCCSWSVADFLTWELVHFIPDAGLRTMFSPFFLEHLVFLPHLVVTWVPGSAFPKTWGVAYKQSVSLQLSTLAPIGFLARWLPGIIVTWGHAGLTCRSSRNTGCIVPWAKEVPSQHFFCITLIWKAQDARQVPMKCQPCDMSEEMLVPSAPLSS